MYNSVVFALNTTRGRMSQNTFGAEVRQFIQISEYKKISNPNFMLLTAAPLWAVSKLHSNIYIALPSPAPRS